MIHSFDGEYSRNPRTGAIQNIKSGGHGQSALDVMDRNGIAYNIVKMYPNGVRVGYIPNHKDKNKQSGTNQAWFPKDWTSKDIKHAGEHVAKQNQK